MATLRVKNLDDGLYRALGVRAVINNRSIGQEVTVMIGQFLANPPSDPRETTRQLLELAGSWADDRSAKQIMSDLRRARRSRG